MGSRHRAIRTSCRTRPSGRRSGEGRAIPGCLARYDFRCEARLFPAGGCPTAWERRARKRRAAEKNVGWIMMVGMAVENGDGRSEYTRAKFLTGQDACRNPKHPSKIIQGVTRSAGTGRSLCGSGFTPRLGGLDAPSLPSVSGHKAPPTQIPVFFVGGGSSPGPSGS